MLLSRGPLPRMRTPSDLQHREAWGTRSPKSALEPLTCKHAPNDGAHTCQEVGKGPAEATGGLAGTGSHRQREGGLSRPRLSLALSLDTATPYPHLCFSVSFTIIGESSYSTKTPGRPWSPSSPLATFSCLVTENWFVLSTCGRKGPRQRKAQNLAHGCSEPCPL